MHIILDMILAITLLTLTVIAYVYLTGITIESSIDYGVKYCIYQNIINFLIPKLLNESNYVTVTELITQCGAVAVKIYRFNELVYKYGSFNDCVNSFEIVIPLRDEIYELMICTK